MSNGVCIVFVEATSSSSQFVVNVSVGVSVAGVAALTGLLALLLFLLCCRRRKGRLSIEYATCASYIMKGSDVHAVQLKGWSHEAYHNKMKPSTVLASTCIFCAVRLIGHVKSL